jgi:hypothetical protein
VLEGQNQAGLEIVPRAFAALGPSSSPREVVEALADAAFDFVQSDPTFFRLIQWSELQGNSLINELGSHWQVIDGALAVVREVLARSGRPQEDARQVLMSIIALCDAHVVHGQTLGLPLGVDVRDAAFLEARRAHLKRFLTAALL